MLKYTGVTDVVIDLPNGIYTFEEKSGIGKTRLTKVLQDYYILGMPVVAITYRDLQLGLNLNEKIYPGKQELLMVDRYDLYNGMLNNVVTTFAKTGVVLQYTTNLEH